MEGILKSDDKLLASLQKLAGEMDSQQPEDDKTVARVRELCARHVYGYFNQKSLSNLTQADQAYRGRGPNETRSDLF